MTFFFLHLVEDGKLTQSSFKASFAEVAIHQSRNVRCYRTRYDGVENLPDTSWKAGDSFPNKKEN